MSCINKFEIEIVEEKNEPFTVHIDWDETDPDLQWWTDLGPQHQEAFIIESLREALDRYVN